MNTINFILSMAGALAWIPILYEKISAKFLKPVITLYPHYIMDIGENEYNVIVSIRIGIHTQKEDAFIENMTLTLEHANGEKRYFKWAQLIEPITQTAINDTIMPTNRLLNAIGYKLPMDTYTEPYISFTSPDFRTAYETNYNQLRIKSFHINKNNADKKQLELYEPYIQLINTYKKYYTWPPGDYKATVIAFTSDKQTISKSFDFHIDETNSQTLQDLHLAMALDILKNTFIREESEKLTYDQETLDKTLPVKLIIQN